MFCTQSRKFPYFEPTLDYIMLRNSGTVRPIFTKIASKVVQDSKKKNPRNYRAKRLIRVKEPIFFNCSLDPGSRELYNEIKMLYGQWRRQVLSSGGGGGGGVLVVGLLLYYISAWPDLGKGRVGSCPGAPTLGSPAPHTFLLYFLNIHWSTMYINYIRTLCKFSKLASLTHIYSRLFTCFFFLHWS